MFISALSQMQMTEKVKYFIECSHLSSLQSDLSMCRRAGHCKNSSLISFFAESSLPSFCPRWARPWKAAAALGLRSVAL